MTVLLHNSRDLPDPTAYEVWFAITGAGEGFDPATKLSGLAARLDQAYCDCRTLWWKLGKEMAGEPGADTAHTPTGSVSVDFGMMLAWSQLTAEVAAEARGCLVVCDDPWLFRHLAGLEGVRAGPPPRLWTRRLALWSRGLLARCKVSLSMALAAILTRPRRREFPGSGPVLLVYAHPSSNAQGFDSYFGGLMKELPGLGRMLHTDCGPRRARELAADGRTASLHSWGNPVRALGLAGERWCPGRHLTEGPHGWLVRRAADKENGGGGPAMNRWQLHCQERWLRAAGPSRVAWPWENLAWERALCRTARRLGVPTIGYQHTVVGRHQINYSSATNPDGLASIPDLVVCNGPAYRDELEAWDIPAERLVIGGAFRIEEARNDIFDERGPVYVPLSGIHQTAYRQLAAARIIGESGRRVLVKDHPMYPLDFAESTNLRRTATPLLEQKALSAVLYSTGTSGLEALLAGLPAFRLLIEGHLAIDVLPRGLDVPAITIDELPGALKDAPRPPRLDWESVLSPVDMDLWRRVLDGHGRLSPGHPKAGG